MSDLTAEEAAAGRAEAERWFTHQGLPWFVDHLRRSAAAALSPQRLVPLLALAAAVSVGAGVGVRILTDDANAGWFAGGLVAAFAFVGYAVLRLHAGAIARWAAGRTLSSLELLLPLVTRALPLLLLFVTFLFINTEVWQVASSLHSGVLWASVVLFASVAVLFLLARLPEELDVVDDSMTRSRVRSAVAGTPVAEYAVCTDGLEDGELAAQAQVVGYAKGNLVLVLLLAQALQVLLLALAVYAFFLVFGMVAIQPSVIESWLGYPPTPVVGDATFLSVELVRVATFLASFSGLYFTVYAVSDATYRDQFFTALLAQLEQAVAVRAVYRVLGPIAAGWPPDDE